MEATEKGQADAAGQALLQRALEKHQAGQLAEAEELYVEVLTAQPHQPDALNLLGVLAAQTGRQEEALKLIRKAIVEQPQNHHFRFNHAHILELAGDPKARQAYRETLTINPYHVPALINLGNLLLKEERVGDAIDCFNRAISAEPKAAPAHEGLGSALRREGLLEDALQAFRKAQALEPDNPDLSANQAALLIELERGEEALPLLRRAISFQPGRAELHVGLAAALWPRDGGGDGGGGGDAEAALQALETALAHEPGNARALGLLGPLQAARGEAEAVAGLADYKTLVRSRRLTRIPDFDDLEAFNRALAEPLQTKLRPLRGPEPAAQGEAGPQALRTGDLAGLEEPAIQTLLETIGAEVAGYFESAAASANPYLPGVPATWRLSLRGELLGAGAARPSQQRPAACLTGFYVVAAPAGGDPDQGALELGRPPARYGKASLPTHRVAPQDGQLLLFPGHLWQARLPVTGDRPLVTLTFDVLAS